MGGRSTIDVGGSQDCLTGVERVEKGEIGQGHCVQTQKTEKRHRQNTNSNPDEYESES